MLLRFKEEKTLESYVRELSWHNAIAVIVPLRPWERYSSLLVGGQIGSGENIREMIALPVVVDRELKEFPIIPSTGIKGVFRKLTYSISKKIYQNIGSLRKLYRGTYIEELLVKNGFLESLIDILSKHDEDNSGKHRECNSTRIPGEIASYIHEIAGDPEIDKKLACEALCPVCSIYGGLYYRSAILFNPIIINPYSRHVRTHVAINRKTMTKADSALFTDHLAILRKENILQLEFMIRDIEPGSPAAKLLAMTLSFIAKHGLLIGGGKSIGYGLLKPISDKVIWYYKSYERLSDTIMPKKNKGMYNLIEFLRTGVLTNASSVYGSIT